MVMINISRMQAQKYLCFCKPDRPCFRAGPAVCMAFQKKKKNIYIYIYIYIFITTDSNIFQKIGQTTLKMSELQINA